MAEVSISQNVCVVYWLYDEKCVCPWRHGYVGISEDLRGRLKNHRQNKKFPVGFSYQILFRGTRFECLRLEEKMRPVLNIGWNYLNGGHAGGHREKHSEETRRKISEKVKNLPPMSEATREKFRIRMLGTTNKGRIGQKKPEEERRKIAATKTGKKLSDKHRASIALGAMGNKSHLGHLHSEETKQVIRLKKTGVPVHTEGHKAELRERMKGNAFTKGKPWSAARRLAWLNKEN